LGGNTGDVLSTFEACTQHIRQKGYEVTGRSGIYTSNAWGYQSQHTYYNQVLILKTNQTPQTTLKEMLEIEKTLGRTRTAPGLYEDRVVDIDILFYDSLVLNEPNLVIPHPRLHERNFCLVPLLEVLPDLVHPVFHQTIQELKKSCTDPGKVSAL
jgi:2-amino-4-hydroxy-6-hydroxymethyldihydropteridine diphosphokinase